MPMEMKKRLKINRFITKVSDQYSRYIDKYTDKQRGQHAQREKLKIKMRNLVLREHLVKISKNDYERVKLSEEEKEALVDDLVAELKTIGIDHKPHYDKTPDPILNYRDNSVNVRTLAYIIIEKGGLKL